MKKLEQLLIRFDPETKSMAAEKAESLGLSVSAYILMLIRLDSRRTGEIDTRKE
jgi:antitoxin component of RelBE/YafQ-DinJ toxin-antitoxin module